MRTEEWVGQRLGTDLVWGVRETFLRYVEGVGGAVEVVSPAVRTPEGAVRFPLSRETSGQLEFSGGVAFRAHRGALHVSFSDPSLEPVHGAEGGALLTVTDTSTGSPARIVLATVDVAGNVALADEALALFDFQYPAGTALDPIAFADPLPGG
ncbi:MAG TPA: HtaA domain-containing protein [Microbacterium sp.]|uniref:HtaA domain-containing protein n=1 Tax=Microbacterium sp. TaxID=51671 RepID=UPI002BEB0D3A|nr:HtaA domain-containing protein [Microbacterium sp.]HWI30542.1 HtaA domain-containing protein [Microbacterium sp.]